MSGDPPWVTFGTAVLEDKMKTKRNLLLVCCAFAVSINPAWVSHARAQGGDRLSDKDVKQLIENVHQTRDRFEDQLDGKIKNALLRTPTGEVDVQKFLDDLQDNVEKLKDRFTPDYAASKEVEVLLTQGGQIQNFMKTQPADLKGRSEWDAMALALDRLAGAYRTGFPLPANPTIRRFNDGETSAIAEDVAKRADDMKSKLGDEKTLPKPAVDAAKKNLDTLKKEAEAVKSRVSDSKPATAEVRQVM
jgi:hypothetical protein